MVRFQWHLSLNFNLLQCLKMNYLMQKKEHREEDTDDEDPITSCLTSDGLEPCQAVLASPSPAYPSSFPPQHLPGTFGSVGQGLASASMGGYSPPQHHSVWLQNPGQPDATAGNNQGQIAKSPAMASAPLCGLPINKLLMKKPGARPGDKPSSCSPALQLGAQHGGGAAQGARKLSRLAQASSSVDEKRCGPSPACHQPTVDVGASSDSYVPNDRDDKRQPCPTLGRNDGIHGLQAILTDAKERVACKSSWLQPDDGTISRGSPGAGLSLAQGVAMPCLSNQDADRPEQHIHRGTKGFMREMSVQKPPLSALIGKKAGKAPLSVSAQDGRGPEEAATKPPSWKQRAALASVTNSGGVSTRESSPVPVDSWPTCNQRAPVVPLPPSSLGGAVAGLQAVRRPPQAENQLGGSGNGGSAAHHFDRQSLSPFLNHAVHHHHHHHHLLSRSEGGSPSLSNRGEGRLEAGSLLGGGVMAAGPCAALRACSSPILRSISLGSLNSADLADLLFDTPTAAANASGDLTTVSAFAREDASPQFEARGHERVIEEESPDLLPLEESSMMIMVAQQRRRRRR